MLIAAGLILILLGIFVGGLKILLTIGIVVGVVGLVFYFVGGPPANRGRRGYWY
jgi:hypothetical protein